MVFGVKRAFSFSVLFGVTLQKFLFQIMRRRLLLKYLQILFFIVIGSVNFLNALKTGSIMDWIVYAVCMLGIIVVAFSIKSIRDAHKGIVEDKPAKNKKAKK